MVQHFFFLVECEFIAKRKRGLLSSSIEVNIFGYGHISGAGLTVEKASVETSVTSSNKEMSGECLGVTIDSSSVALTYAPE